MTTVEIARHNSLSRFSLSCNTMSRKGSAVRGDPTDDTGNPVLGQDDQEWEEMSASLNSGAGLGAGVQSTPVQQTSVSGQGMDVGREISLRVRAVKWRLTL